MAVTSIHTPEIDESKYSLPIENGGTSARSPEQAAENIGKSINTKSNEASIGMSVDGQQVFIYKDDNSDGNIYSTTLDGDEWSKPEKLNFNTLSESFII